MTSRTILLATLIAFCIPLVGCSADWQTMCFTREMQIRDGCEDGLCTFSDGTMCFEYDANWYVPAKTERGGFLYYGRRCNDIVDNNCLLSK